MLTYRFSDIRPVASTCPPQLSKCLGSEATRRVASYLSRNINNTHQKNPKRTHTMYQSKVRLWRSGLDTVTNTSVEARQIQDRIYYDYDNYDILQPGFPLLVSGRCHQNLLPIHTVQILETNLYLTSCKLAVICSDHIDGEVEDLKRSRNMWNMWNFGKRDEKGPDSYGTRLPRCQAVGIAFPLSWWAPTNITPFRASERQHS